MYNFIIDPISLNKVNIFTKKGKKIINNYKKKIYFKNNNNLSLKKKKFCRCVLHVAKKNTEKCNRNKVWNNKCYNPYKVCAKSVKTTTGGKSCFYDFTSQDIPDEEILGYYYLNSNNFDKWRIKNNIESNSIKELRQQLNKWYNLYKLRV